MTREGGPVPARPGRRTGADGPGKTRPTIRDVARRAQVSKTTVSRVLNGKPDVDPATIELVQAVVEEMGYVPSASAVSLARGRAHSIGLLAPALSRPWVLEVLRGVAEGIETTDYSLTLFTTSRSEASMQELRNQLRSQALDGLAIMQPPWHSDPITDFPADGTPVVLIDDRNTHPNIPSVGSADRDGIIEAIQHLASLQRHKVAIISGPIEIGCHRERLAAFREACKLAGVPARTNLICEARDDSYRAGYQAAERLLARGASFDALFVGNDAMALGAMRCLRAEGVDIPGEVAICGFDDIAAARFADPPLTTVYNPLYEMGGRAMRMLLDACDGTPMPAEPQILPTRLVARASTLGHTPEETGPDSELLQWADISEVEK
ncbi:MAG TPA: LacI family DNA-binding transcriptional regulator [Streptosporangiaceae bacterium]